jgi:hypothetical protein
MYSIDVIGRRRLLEANEPKSRRSLLLERTRSAIRVRPPLREVPNA